MIPQNGCSRKAVSVVGCLKNEFKKLSNKRILVPVLALALSFVMVLHLVVDVDRVFKENLELRENGRSEAQFTGLIERMVDSFKEEVSELRAKAETLAKSGRDGEAKKLLDNADFDEQIIIPRYNALLENGIDASMWQYECTYAAIRAISGGEKELTDRFERALDDDDYMLFLQAMCDSLKDPNDDLELGRLYKYLFLLETESIPDKKSENWFRADRYSQNKRALLRTDSEAEKKKLIAENEWLVEAAKRNAGNPDANPALFCITEMTTIALMLSSVGLIGVFSAVAVFGVDRKRKRIPAVYLLPVSRSRINLSKLLAAFIASAAGVAVYLLIYLVSLLFLAGKSTFETVFILLLGRSFFCTPFTVFAVMVLAMIPVLVLVISFVFFIAALTKNVPVAAVSGVVVSVLFFVFKIRVYNGGDEVYWLRYGIVSVADWTPFVLNSQAAPGQSFVWTVIAFALHAVVFVLLGLVLERYSED